MNDRIYKKVNTSIQTGSNAEHLVYDSEGNVEATIELRLPDNLFALRDGPKKIDTVEMQTSKFRLSMENTPIAQMPLDTDRSTRDTVATTCQLDVYPFCLLDDQQLMPKTSDIETQSAFPYYKNHTVEMMFIYVDFGTTPATETVLETISWQSNTVGYGFPTESRFYPFVVSSKILENTEHVLNMCAQSNHENYVRENDSLFVRNIGTLEQMLQDGLENAVSYASTASNLKLSVYLVNQDNIPMDIEPEPDRRYTIVLDEFGVTACYWKIKKDVFDSVDENHLTMACKPSVKINEQSISISYDTAAFGSMIPVFWNTPFVETWDNPEQMTIDRWRKDQWGQPPPKRTYKYACDVDDETKQYAFAVLENYNCAPMNLIANQVLRDTFSFLPWIPLDLRTIKNLDLTVPSKKVEIKNCKSFPTAITTYSGDNGRSMYLTDHYFDKTYVIKGYHMDNKRTTEGRVWEDDFDYLNYIDVPNSNAIGFIIKVSYDPDTHGEPTGLLWFDNNNFADYITDIQIRIAPDVERFERTILPRVGKRIIFANDFSSTTEDGIPWDYPSEVVMDEFYTSNDVDEGETTIFEKRKIRYGAATYLGGGLDEAGFPAAMCTTAATGYIRNVKIEECNASADYFLSQLQRFDASHYDIPICNFMSAPFIMWKTVGSTWFLKKPDRNDPTTWYYISRFRLGSPILTAIDVKQEYEIDIGYWNFITLESPDADEFNGHYWDEEHTQGAVCVSTEDIVTVQKQIVTIDPTKTDVSSKVVPNIDTRTFYVLDGTTADVDIGQQEVVQVLKDPYKFNIYEENEEQDQVSTRTQVVRCSTVAETEDDLPIYGEYYDGNVLLEGVTVTDPESHTYQHVIHYVYQEGVVLGRYNQNVFVGTASGLNSSSWCEPFVYSDTTTPFSNDGDPVLSGKTFITKSNNPEYTDGEIIDHKDTVYSDVEESVTSVDLDPNEMFVDNIYFDLDFDDGSGTEQVVSSGVLLTGSIIEGTKSYVIPEEQYATATWQVADYHHVVWTLHYEAGRPNCRPCGCLNVETTEATPRSLKWNRCTTEIAYRRTATSKVAVVEANEPEWEYIGNIRLNFTWNNLPMVVMSPIQSIVLTLSGIDVQREVLPINMAQPGGSSLTSTIPVIENYYSLAQTLRDLHDELVVTKDQFDDTATYRVANLAGQERTLTLSAQFIGKDGRLHKIYIPKNGVFSLQLIFGISYYY